MINKTIVLLMLFSFVEAGNCWKIKNKDQRALCESQNEDKKSCWKIKDKDIRAYCEASAYGKKSCWKIKNRDKRAMCEAEEN